MLSWRPSAISGVLGGSCLARIKPIATASLTRRLQSAEAHNPDHHSTQSPGRRLPAWRVKRRAHLPFSPSEVISERLYTRGARLTREEWTGLQRIAEVRSTRLPVMTAQLLLRQDEERLRTSLSEHFDDDDSWPKRLDMLAWTGITREHLDHWVWILQGETTDERVTRFLSGDVYKPVFLLGIMLRKNHSVLDRRLFMSLLDYVDKTYCQPRPPPSEPIQYRSLDAHLNMTPRNFIALLDRLVDHALRLRPEALVIIAELVTSYIKTRWPADASPPDPNSYAIQCRIFNAALRTFSRTSYLRPYANREHSWDAQKHLLSFSTALARPFIVNEAGYRAIQSVMVGRAKSAGEEKRAIRQARSWPPYRQAWDGLDEQRRLEDDLSRAVKVGILAREAGYPEAELDRALGAAGGAVLGLGPTVQTRLAVAVQGRGGRRSAEDVYTTWAALVRATRNAHEAWGVFRRPPQENLKPSAEVYGAMFAKLLAPEIADPATAVPGNRARNEVFPVHQPGNLSEFEKWRTQPPTVSELYEDMLASGVKPVAQVLRLLVANADSEEEAARYLRDSPYHRFVAAVQPFVGPPTPEQAARRLYGIKSVPLGVFNAYVSFLCKMQTKANETDPSGPDTYLQRALRLVSVRLKPETAEGRTYKPPWYHVLRTLVLGRSYPALRGSGLKRQVGLFLDVFGWVVRNTGVDAVMLEIACLTAGRVMAASFSKRRMPGGSDDAMQGRRWWEGEDSLRGDAEGRKVLSKLWVETVGAWEGMRECGSGMNGFQVFVYLRVLGMYGDVEGMVQTVRWVLERVEKGDGFGDACVEGTYSHGYMVRALGFFGAYMEGKGREDAVGMIGRRRRRLVEEGLPLELGEMEERDRLDLELVRMVAEGWERDGGEKGGKG